MNAESPVPSDLPLFKAANRKLLSQKSAKNSTTNFTATENYISVPITMRQDQGHTSLLGTMRLSNGSTEGSRIEGGKRSDQLIYMNTDVIDVAQTLREKGKIEPKCDSLRGRQLSDSILQPAAELSVSQTNTRMGEIQRKRPVTGKLTS